MAKIYFSMLPTLSLEKVSSYGLLPQFIYISPQGRSQTSEQDEASFDRRRCEPLGGVGASPPPQGILKSRGSEMLV